MLTIQIEKNFFASLSPCWGIMYEIKGELFCQQFLSFTANLPEQKNHLLMLQVLTLAYPQMI